GQFFVDNSSGTEQFGRLVALTCAVDSAVHMRAFSYMFDSTMTATQRQYVDLATCKGNCGSVFAEGVRLDWNSAAEQVAYTFTEVTNTGTGDEAFIVGVLSWNGTEMAVHNYGWSNFNSSSRQ